MRKEYVFLIVLVSIATFLLVYTPHYNNPFPLHIDEWHHITESIKIQDGLYHKGVSGFRVGFQILLLFLSKFVNLVLFYKFLPAIWAVFSNLVLFWAVYRKTEKRFFIALFSMVFFASIKSNVNITGLWFFTPLSFSILFIYLYIYFLTDGIEKQNKKFIFYSFVIMVVLTFVHSISVLFSIPFLLIYSLFNFKYIKKEWKFFSIFFLIPLVGAIFYKFMSNVSGQSLITHLIKALQFKRGWGVLELNNSFFELYSLTGYILAIIGFLIILRDKSRIKKYLVYLLWPVTMLIFIFFYRKTGVSYLSPYQRNLYYFVISLPPLSAMGLEYVIRVVDTSINKYKTSQISKSIGIFVLLGLMVFFTFKDYTKIPKQIAVYKVIDNDEYKALLFLSRFPERARVMAPLRISTALYSISHHLPVGTYFFYGNREDVDRFFLSRDCKTKKMLIRKYNVKFVFSKIPINCGWKLIYDKNLYIYKVK